MTNVENMIMLDNVQENAVLENLKKRYASDAIYTYIGEVLISVNPFKPINGLYSESKTNQYRSKYSYELPPHIYAIAESAYRGITVDHKSQAIIITGESGAGKTEASKQIMHYLASVSSVTSGVAQELLKIRTRSFVKKRGSENMKTLNQTINQRQQDDVKNQILKSNPILEAFGNAKTVRNNNSSRFGKYMEIFFNLQGAIIGGQVTNFLLEKSRVISQSNGERSFHIFYQIFTDKKLKKSLQLTTPDQYKYLNQSACYTVPDINDEKDFNETKNALTAIGFKKKVVDRIFELLAAILHMGNLEYRPVDNGCRIATPEILMLVAQLLHIEPSILESGLTTKTVEAGGRNSLYMSPLTATEAIHVRDALAKAIYGKLFDYIITQINDSISNNISKKRLSNKIADNSQSLSIGILDIYGFEIFEANSFEQLCINYVNERLQKIFIELTLEREQKEYAAEGIKWDKIPYNDNTPCVDIIDAKMGIFSLLNETCLLNKDENHFFGTLKTNIKNNRYIAWQEQKKNVFTVKHYAGDVQYSTDGFIQKNTDTLYQSLVTMMTARTACPLLSELFSVKGLEEESSPPDKFTRSRVGGPSKRPPMIATQFKKQVDELMDKLYKCNTHYVRCMKPNNDKRSGLFAEDMMMHQIRYLGLLENIRVRRAGFVYRQPFGTFVHHYGLILNDKISASQDPKDSCSRIVRQVLTSEQAERTDQKDILFALGKTKIFLRNPELVFTLEEMRERALPAYAIRIQKAFRAYHAKKFYIDLREDVCKELTKLKKKRRRISFGRVMMGDYLKLQEQAPIVKLLDKYKDTNVMYSGDVFKTNHRYKVQQRTIMITNNAIYTLASKTSRKNTKQWVMKRRLEIADIDSVTLSPFTDGFFILGYSKRYDYILRSDDKTEIIAVLMRAYRDLKRAELNVQVQERFQYRVSKRETRTWTFIQVLGESDEYVSMKPAKNQVNVFIKNEPEYERKVIYRK